jgi:hypothetical protein
LYDIVDGLSRGNFIARKKEKVDVDDDDCSEIQPGNKGRSFLFVKC